MSEEVKLPPTTCWAIECHDLTPSPQYATWTEMGFDWDCRWERALKFFDRASCEMMCAEMPFEWDVRIMEHQFVPSKSELALERKIAALTKERDELMAKVAKAETLALILGNFLRENGWDTDQFGREWFEANREEIDRLSAALATYKETES